MSTIETHDYTELDLQSRRLILLVPFLAATVVWSWWTTNPYIPWLLAVPIAYFFLCATSLLHEFIHRINHVRCRWWARFIGMLIVTPATAYRETHVRHHAYLNRPVDWELWPYSDPNCSRGFRRLFAWFDILAGLATSPLVYGRIYWSRQSPLSPEVRRQITFEYLASLVFWGAVIAGVAYYGQWWNFTLAVMLPWWMAGVMQTMRKFTEHLGMSSFDPLEGTRTVHGGNVITRVCSYLNSDIFVHGPHHRSPMVTADELDTFATELRTQQERKLPFYRTYFAATWAMLPHLLLNPGCGENATPGPTDPSQSAPVTA
ncbi:fatty acid desaturase family protein [Planctomyces sp. SH-PL14]|uniref:fatty acid desaturase family protein n=1 Tax=Planctomyces sp. SH-PL14 TaxID=1632864 RepID=UPI00078DE89C|nr:fatty acid desaturase [Planctomyces sp. SH-PL14]AMV16920.1 Fatty acid desaturase [Planctomyces sp. SH-PL14]